ncbi:3'-phosphoadenosine 5'-phosphosulfate (PAPS) 3'-phosphatase [Cryptosporangium arvum DSM 44712]|uniref:3'(2'),5-bisphosphonucleoside 3'(2')-phosphohydrolase n=2 Tax=Cryptosporangium TaxID=65502 RepID=A0A010ZMM4_9ACTN|nr:3'(2'),5'-bisphosphate nucleotidase CysQ [Cryptosporangium arvum]EXG79929.1 3'-phosphoadenosine 5'-phosphosulfate (PAPS) 3'-phosphatase [Cryptosporangium arvum DSM 44712]
MTSDADTETIAARMTCDSDVELARLLATHAGVILLRLRKGKRVPASRLKADGDRRSHDFLTAALAKLRPGDAVLSEEGADDHARLEAGRVWIVDPLDGTREYSELDRDDWAIHVALWENGELTAGAVALPGLGPTLTSELSPRPRPAAAQPRILVSRSRPPAYAETVAEKLGAELVPMGSAGAKAMAVVRGQAEAYLHDGGQYEWDSAAPVVVARAAGLHTSRVDGSPLRYNNPNPYQPDLLICRPELADPILQAIATAK